MLCRCPEEPGRFHQPCRHPPFPRQPRQLSCVTAGRPRAGAEELAATNPLPPRRPGSIPGTRHGRASVSPPAAVGLFFPAAFPRPKEGDGVGMALGTHVTIPPAGARFPRPRRLLRGRGPRGSREESRGGRRGLGYRWPRGATAGGRGGLEHPPRCAPVPDTGTW